MKRILLNILLFTIPCISFSQKSEIGRSLSFETQPSKNEFWQSTGNETLIEKMLGKIPIHPNSIDFTDGKQSWIINNPNKDFHTYIFSYFNLTQKSNRIQVSIFSKTRNLQKAWLKVYCLDIDENTIKKDSLSLVNQRDWEKFTLKLTAKKTERLYIEIEAESFNSEQFPWKEKPFLMVDQCEIRVDDKIFESVPASIVTKTAEVKNLIKLDSTTFKGIESVTEFEKHRIIALGESVHGSDEMQRYTFETIKHLIGKGNCRLVLFELNFELGLWLNAYVLGEVAENNIEHRLRLYNYNYQRFSDLLKWIREFNQNNDKKVRICGIDKNMGIEQLSQIDNLIDFIQIQPYKNDNINNLTALIKNREYDKALELIKNENLFVGPDTDKTLYVKRAIELRKEETNYGNYLPYEHREIIQFNNSKFAINNWLTQDEKAVIYAHLGHVNKQNGIYTRLNFINFGNLMYRDYANDYFVVAFLTGSGTISSVGNTWGWNNTTFPLSYPVEGSLEKQLMQAKVPLYYVSVKNLKPCYFIRLVGFNYTENQFYTSGFRKKFDGVVFIKQSTAYNIIH